ncbi:MAG: phosphoribosylanthranilate isomerase [Acidimicrobiales bacterium]
MFIKICGTTNLTDAALAVSLGVDALGFVFAESKRQVDAPTVANIVKELPRSMMTVGVVRNASVDEILKIFRETKLSAIQLHGHEGPEVSKALRSEVPFLIQAFTADDPRLAQLREYDIDAILLDSPTPGSGETFDWSRISDLPHRFRVILAGGLNPTNIAEAIAGVGPWGVDVVSGVEAEPGRKDPVALTEFVGLARDALSEFSTDPTQA